MRVIYVLAILFFPAINSLSAQNLFFKDSGQNKKFTTKNNQVIKPAKYRGLVLNFQKIKKFLEKLPDESKMVDRNQAPIMSLIKPDGTIARFRVWQSSVQQAETPKNEDYVMTFAGQGIDDPYATIRFDFSKYGFHAQVRSPKGDYLIDPYAVSEIKKYMSYYKSDLSPPNPRDPKLPDISSDPSTPVRVKQ